MKKHLWMVALAMMMGCMMMTSCEIENGDKTADTYYAILADSRWQLTELLDGNNRWQSVELYPLLEIPELRFFTNGSYEMDIKDYDGYQGISTVTGSYRIHYGTIIMSNDFYQGTAFEIHISRLDDDVLEGSFGLWSGLTPIDPWYNGGNAPEQVRHFNVRMLRIGN